MKRNAALHGDILLRDDGSRGDGRRPKRNNRVVVTTKGEQCVEGYSHVQLVTKGRTREPRRDRHPCKDATTYVHAGAKYTGAILPPSDPILSGIQPHRKQ